MDWSNLLTLIGSVPVPLLVGIICFKRADRVKEELSSEITKLKERVSYLEGKLNLRKE